MSSNHNRSVVTPVLAWIRNAMGRVVAHLDIIQVLHQNTKKNWQASSWVSSQRRCGISIQLMSQMGHQRQFRRADEVIE
jgi:hypothetical protein